MGYFDQFLSQDVFLTKGQKLMFYLILLKLKNIDHNIEYNKLYNFFDNNVQSNPNFSRFVNIN